MNDKTKFILAVSFSAGVVIAGSIIMYKVERDYRAKRREIEKNLELDRAAIRNARARMLNNLKNGRYDDGFDVNTIMQEMNQEIEFEKIAVRYPK